MARQEGPGVPAPSMREPVGDFDVVSEDEWNAAREKLLVEEKARKIEGGLTNAQMPVKCLQSIVVIITD